MLFRVKVCLEFVVLGVGLVMLVGCGGLRFAPGQAQKQNAYLHHRTVQATALRAVAEEASPVLQSLSQRATGQSEAIMAYYGLPDELPESDTLEQLLSGENEQITQAAGVAAIKRPDPWDVADNLLEMGIAVAGVFGGVFGTRALRALQVARQKSEALREIVQNNELFKQQNPEQAGTFKQAQQSQSNETKTLVAQMK
ncbi:MAG: hypothetical protein JXD22_13220 [Sedimentisphaerales bacterium]|nr:hypothetical protein [Sedimentisphaerales bacterium]